MDMKTKVSMEIEKNSGDKKNLYVFMMDYGCPLGEAYDACHEVLEKIVKLSQEASDRAKRKEEDKKEN